MNLNWLIAPAVVLALTLLFSLGSSAHGEEEVRNPLEGLWELIRELLHHQHREAAHLPAPHHEMAPKQKDYTLIGLLMLAGLIAFIVGSITTMFNVIRDAGLAWERAFAATASAGPSLARDGLAVIVWEWILKPTITMIPVLGEGFGIFFTLASAGAAWVLGRFYKGIWTILRFIFGKVLFPFFKFIVKAIFAALTWRWMGPPSP